ncbi:hypothetical protein D3C76_1771720 [compost metagenome]
MLAQKGPGDLINLETDILGKYVERLLSFRSGSPSGQGGKGRLSEAFLAENGFL